MTEWRPIPGHPGYEASSEGEIRSVERVVTYVNGRQRRFPSVVLKTRMGHHYPVVAIGTGGRYRGSHPVHQLVAAAFHGVRPDGMHACHNDGNIWNNRPSNLRWDTPSENVWDQVRHGTHHNHTRTHCPRGHELTGGNLKAAALLQGRRDCRACAAGRTRAQRTPGTDFQTEADRYYAQYVKEDQWTSKAD